MKLSQLPSDLLAQIIPDPQIFTLMKCGDLLLNGKLQSGVRELALALHPIGKPRVPRLVAQLRVLRSFSIKSSRGFFKDPCQAVAFTKSLPPTLEMLEVDCGAAFNWFMNSAPSSTSTCPIYIKTQYSRGLSRLIDLESLFPRLHTLKSGNSYIVSDLAALPASLTYFSAGNIWFQPKDGRSLSLLPPSLKTLEGTLALRAFASDFESHAAYWEDWRNGHPQLEQLGDIFLYEYAFVSYLPRTIAIRSIKLSHCTVKLLSGLPECVHHLEVASLDKTEFNTVIWSSILPRKLESLHATFYPASIALTLSQLPKSLASLTCQPHWHFKGSEILNLSEKRDFWPPNLTVIHNFNIYDLSDISLLPRTLKSLRIALPSEFDDHPMCLDGSLFPPGLTDLSILNLKSAIDIINPLPAMLKVLEIKSDLTKSFGVNRKSFEMIPKSITRLSITPQLSQWPLHDEVPYILSSHLIELDLGIWHIKWIGDIPKSVTKLRLALYESYEIDLAATNQLFKDLPTNLTTLELSAPGPSGDDGTIFSAGCLSTLPCLQSLDVDFGRFPSSFIRNLPKSLTSLAVNMEALDEKDAPFLPPRCLRLDLNGPTDWNNPIIAEHWPVAALSLQVPHGSRTLSRQKERKAQLAS